MEALYWRRPTAEELTAMGLKARHVQAPEVEVWPEAWAVIDLYSRRLSTQWRGAGMGLIGLDYAIAYAEIDRLGLAGEDREDLIDLLRIVERVAIERMAAA